MFRSCKTVPFLVVVALLVSLAVPTMAAPKLVLKLGTIRAEDDPTTLAANRFAELVKSKSGGSIEVKVYPNSQLGGINDMFAGMKVGLVDMMYEGLSSYPWVKGAEDFNIIAVPFLWKSYDHMKKALATPTFQKLFENAAEKSGVRVIVANGEAEARQLTTKNRPVKTPADFKGLKIRIAESAMVRKAMQALGANPIVIPFSELYMALRQGVAEAQENGFLTIKNQSLYEVQKYLIPTYYIRDVKAWYIGDAKWKSLSAEQQKILREAAEEAGDYMTAMTRKQLDETLAFLKTKMTVVEPDLDAIRKVVTPAFEDEDGKMWPRGLLKFVRDLD
ncbi:MAG TPA: TRAP transporter substrate-binding protein [Firmicutes bacterium]|nr:TRAP transporter substrate-binding protein [Bacillota bacterium]